ncbi:MAG TPA: hypothetical protein VKT30_16015 [Caulobacteraceae bacterium]|nr:hypothetical protein [Caulobacteraceae bacterium]
MRRPSEIILGAALAVLLVGNGAAMLFAGSWWYGAVPGVTETGPFNPHFVKDVGAAYVVAGVGFAAFAWRPGPMLPALAAATGFLSLHALVHVADAIASPNGVADIIRDFPGVFVPALVGLGLCAASIRRKEPAYA